MAKRLSITQNEILDALAKAARGNAPADARTMLELVATTTVRRDRLLTALKLIAAQDRLMVHQVTRTALDGRQAKVPAYTILPKKRG